VDAETGELARTVSVGEWYHSLRFSADGAYLLVSGWNVNPAELKVWP
jgi:hypothetical protein